MPCNSPSAVPEFFVTHPCYVWNRWELQDRLQLEALSLLRAQPGFSHLNQAKPTGHLPNTLQFHHVIQTKRNRFGVFPGRFSKHVTKPKKKTMKHDGTKVDSWFESIWVVEIVHLPSAHGSHNPRWPNRVEPRCRWTLPAIESMDQSWRHVVIHQSGISPLLQWFPLSDY